MLRFLSALAEEGEVRASWVVKALRALAAGSLAAVSDGDAPRADALALTALTVLLFRGQALHLARNSNGAY